MPYKLSLKKIIYLLIGVTMLLWLTGSLLLRTSNGSAILSSLTPGLSVKELKALSLKPKTNLLRRTSKLLPHFEVQLKNLTSEVVWEDEIFELAGEVVGDLNYQNMNYKWTLPEGLERISSTPLTGVMSAQDIQNNRLRILLRQRTSIHPSQTSAEIPNLKIHLSLWPQTTGLSQTSSAQYNTTRQPQIDLEKEELAKRNEAYLLEQQLLNQTDSKSKHIHH